MGQTGVLLIAYGKRGYGFAAYNLAFSIKYFNPSIHITLWCEQSTVDQISSEMFDDVVVMPDSWYKDGHHYNPAKAKIHVVGHAPYDQTLYIDVDTMCTKDLDPLINQLSSSKSEVIVDVFGSGKKGDDIPYDVWAKHEDSFPFFALEETDTWYTTNTSWFFVRRGKSSREHYNMLRYFHDKRFPLNKLKNKWGKYLPDELLFSGVLSRLGGCDVVKPMYFCNDYITGTEAMSKYYFLSMYGNGNGRTLVKPHWWDFIDATLKNMYADRGMKHKYKVSYVQEDKHLNG